MIEPTDAAPPPPATAQAISRRRLCAALAGAGVLGCMSERGPAADEPAGPPPTPELVVMAIAVVGATSREIKVYSDGRALWSDAQFASPGEAVDRRLGRVSDAQLAGLRDLLGSPAYLAITGQTGKMPQGTDRWRFLGGPGPQLWRHIDDVRDLPAELRALLTSVGSIESTLRRDGAVAFSAARNGLLVTCRRILHPSSFRDEITVFADGLAEYRRTWDDPPVLRTARLAPEVLEELRFVLVTAKRPATGPEITEDNIPAAGTSRSLELDTRGAFNVAADDVPPGLQRVVAALAPVYAQLGAPPDEPFRAG